MIGFQIERTLVLGLKSLWLHRLRSLLTVLGIVFGVCSVIAMLAIGEGASYEAQEQIMQLGSTNIIIRAVKPQEEQSNDNPQRRALQYGLTYEDAERIATTIPSVEVTVPVRHIPAEAWVGARRNNVLIAGTVPWFPRIMGRPVAAGRFLTSTDLYYGSNVCVLEPGASPTALFPIDDPVGRSIKVGGDYYRVVGVMAASSQKGQASGKSKDESAGSEVYIPLTAARTRFGETIINFASGSMDAEQVAIHEIGVRASSVDAVVETAAICKEVLARFHKKTDYEIIVPLELLQTAETDQAHLQHRARLRRGHLAPGRRHRHHEHHARQRHRAHARDRHPPRPRRQEAPHHHPIPHRDRAALRRPAGSAECCSASSSLSSSSTSPA